MGDWHLHRHQREWDGNWHADAAPQKALAMQRLPLGGQSLEDTQGIGGGYHSPREDDLDPLAALELVGAAAGRQGRDRLETPFLVGDAPEGVVAVVDHLALPARLHLLPPSPRLGRVRGGPVDIVVVVLVDVGALSVQERPPRREREEEQPHGSGVRGAHTVCDDDDGGVGIFCG